ncbi:hypothetical protein IL306_007163 [Fusarium sp. DS 682]|nr:hypothetical protein IL306_007163 [Fusarium sp. DS 682]
MYDFLDAHEDFIEAVNQSSGEFEAPFLLAVRKGFHKMVEWFLDTGKIDIGIRDAKGNTSFFLAISLRHIVIARLLLGTGALGFHQQIAEAFVKATVDDFKELESSTSLPGTNKLPSVLQQHLWRTIKQGELRMMRLLLSESEVGVHEEGVERQTPISWALQQEKGDVVEVLVNSDRFDIHQEGKEVGRRLFWWAIGKGDDRVVSMVHNSGKFSVNTKDRSGRTPLIYFAEIGAEEEMKLLLKTGNADAYAFDNRGNTALCIAAQRGNKAMVAMLSAYMKGDTSLAIRSTEL